MDKLSVEIHSQIIALACFDDNNTGRSLALTCKWLGEIADLVRFEAVSLCGTSTVAQFAMMLEKFPHRATATSGKIKHLFVSNLDRKEAEVQRKRMNEKMRKLAMDYNLIVSDDNGEKDDEDYDLPLMQKERGDSFYDAFHQVLHHASQSIRTLSIITTLQCARELPAFPMPNLTDFSTISAYRGFVSSSTYANLRRIHTDLNLAYGLDGKLINFRNHAPVLEELRVTNLYPNRIESTNFMNTLSNHARWIESRDRNDNLVFPESTKSVLVQSCSPPYGALCGNAYSSYYYWKREIIRIAKQIAESEDRHAGFRVGILPAPDVYLWTKGRCSGLDYSFDDARRDWTDILLGDGKGCWDDVDQEDFEIGA